VEDGIVTDAERMGSGNEGVGPSAASIAAVGNDAEKLQWIVLNHVDGVQMRDMFWELSGDVDVDEITCSEAISILRSMNEEEKSQCCKAALNVLLNKEDPRYVQLERVLSTIFIVACNEGVLSLSECCELLILCTDFTLSTPIDARKFEYMQRNLHLIDYKGLRNILKLLVVERMQEIPSTITHHHRHMLLPVENMLLTLIDRQLNLLPCLFTITELHRVSSNSRAFLLPRVAKKFNEMFISFRPLTEMVTVIGRPWLYPIAAHISFPVSTSSWRLEVATTRLHQRAHLPYKSELFAPQSSLLYTLLRQPRGKDTLSYVMRQNTNMTPQRMQCDELLHMIILEAMSEMEKTDMRLDDPANQYQWMNITQTVTFSLLHGTASFSRLLKILYESLSETVYRKGRDELMWVILQYVAVYIGKVSNEDMLRIADIYNLLYSDEQCWSGADTDPLLFVRFLVPAAIWMHFYKKLGSQASEVLPKPSESLLRQIQFLQEKTADSDPAIQNVADHNAVLAAVANAYSNDMQNFHKLVLTAVDLFLDGPGDDAGSLWRLPHGIICFPKKTSLPLPLIDSLTFHSRNHLFQMCLLKISTMLNVQQTSKLPSPASIDTLVRLAATTEFEYGVKQVLGLMPRALASISASANMGTTNQPDRSRDLLYILCDILSYRLINYPLPVIPKVNVVLSCYSALSNSQVQMNVPLYSALEQVMLRYWMWNSPQEMIILCNALIGKQGKLTALISSPNSFGEAQHASTMPHERPHANLHVSPEMLRSLLLSVFRALKLTGVEMASEVLQRCNANFSWPLSVSRTFSAQLIGCSIDDGSDSTHIEELFHCVLQDVRRTHEFLCSQAEEHLVKYFTVERRHTLLCVIYNLIYDSKKLHPVFYSMLNSMTAKDIIVMVNKFVDYFIYIFKKNPPSDDQTFTTMVSVLNDMVFMHQLIPFDRLLAALVLHPTDDRATEISLLIIHSMVGSFPDVRSRLGLLFHFIPSNKIVNTNSSFFNKMSEYYSQYPELTYREMEAKLRRELQLEMGIRQMEQPTINPELHMPIYYGNLAERILPIVDILLQRALETVVADQLFNTLLMSFKPCYKYHPQPAAYMYSVLYCLDKTLSHTARARIFVLEICGQLEERDGKYALLTPSFIQDNHQLSLPSQFCQLLVDRILQASHYPHQPPHFVYRDWRFAELPPAGQALTGACIELLASPHAPAVTARALIDLVFIRPLHQPYATINTVALILTALPSSFQHVFYDHIVSVLDSEALTQGDPSICFESLESECFLLTENQLLTNLALGHAYLQHCNTSSLAALPEFVRDQLAPKLVTEAQLIFVLRLVVPILQRFYDAKERSKQIQDLAVDVYKMTVKVNERVGVLKYEDAICDLLYHMKYMYVGDFVKNEAEQAIQRLSPSMRVKLKYISHS
uniref:Mediator of RNA polymerase II transcription subunit 23 n=3 Tax=Parascaris univalens TaxID=6257 RepID=A0A915BTY7_PARUN